MLKTVDLEERNSGEGWKAFGEGDQDRWIRLKSRFPTDHLRWGEPGEVFFRWIVEPFDGDVALGHELVDKQFESPFKSDISLSP